MSAPERIWAWAWDVNPNMGQWEAERSIVGEGAPYVPEAALTAAQAKIARLTAERDAAMAGRGHGIDWRPMETAPEGEITDDVGCRGASEWFLGRPAQKYADFRPPFIVIRRRAWPQGDNWECAGQAFYVPSFFDAWAPLDALHPDTERAESVPCPCTMFEQDESCPEGYPARSARRKRALADQG